MFDVFQVQRPGCPHSHGALVRSSRSFRTAPPPFRRHNWAAQAAMFNNEKTEKELAAHFAMYNRKGGGEPDKAARAAHGNGRARDSKHGLPLFAPYKNLPPDGKALTEEEELCNPEERSCKVPMYVWERKCFACSGTGFVRSSSRSRRGRSTSGVCPTCVGMGYVRCTSSRIIPELNNGTGPHFTLARPKYDEEEDEQ